MIAEMLLAGWFSSAPEPKPTCHTTPTGIEYCQYPDGMQYMTMPDGHTYSREKGQREWEYDPEATHGPGCNPPFGC